MTTEKIQSPEAERKTMQRALLTAAFYTAMGGIFSLLADGHLGKALSADLAQAATLVSFVALLCAVRPFLLGLRLLLKHFQPREKIQEPT